MSDPRIDNPMWLVRVDPETDERLTGDELRRFTDSINEGRLEMRRSGMGINVVNLGALAQRIERALRPGYLPKRSDFSDQTKADRAEIEKEALRWPRGERHEVLVESEIVARVLWIEQLLANAFCGSEAASAYQPSTSGKELDSCDVS
jgi:hypothetical protein